MVNADQQRLSAMARHRVGNNLVEHDALELPPHAGDEPRRGRAFGQPSQLVSSRKFAQRFGELGEEERAACPEGVGAAGVELHAAPGRERAPAWRCRESSGPHHCTASMKLQPSSSARAAAAGPSRLLRSVPDASTSAQWTVVRPDSSSHCRVARFSTAAARGPTATPSRPNTCAQHGADESLHQARGPLRPSRRGGVPRRPRAVSHCQSAPPACARTRAPPPTPGRSRDPPRRGTGRPRRNRPTRSACTAQAAVARPARPRPAALRPPRPRAIAVPDDGRRAAEQRSHVGEELIGQPVVGQFDVDDADLGLAIGSTDPPSASARSW